MKINHFRLLIFGVISSLAVGCTTIPVDKYNALKSSSEVVFEKTSDTYSRIDKLQRSFMVATAPDSTITKDTFKPTIDGQSIDISPELRFREDALEVLVKYTNMIASLVSKDYQSNLDKASLELSASLKKLSSTALRANTDEVAGISAALVNVAGKLIIEHKRKDALEKAMDMSQTSIESLSKLVVASNGKIKLFLSMMESRLIAHANSTRPKYNTADRYDYDLKVANMISEVEEINMALDVVNNAMTQYPGAHKEIRSLLDRKGSKVDMLESLVKEAQRANKLYRTFK